MPHVIVKLVTGRSDAKKAAIADAVTKAVMATADCDEAAVSVSIQDVAPDRWTEDVYQPDISADWDRVFKKPGYEPG